jgi:beta-lactamase regulating signal transducer with metallopeptidase domain
MDLASLPLDDGAAIAAALVVAKATLLLAAAGATALLLKHRSAAARHLVWLVCLSALVLLPALAMALPRWTVPVPVPGALRDALAPAAQVVRVASAEGGLPAMLPQAPTLAAGWGTVLWLAWGGGALLVAAWFAVAYALVRRRARGAVPVTDGAWADLRDVLCAELDVRVPVRLLRGAPDDMPMTWGLLRPTVLLPDGTDAWPEDRRRAVLLHELAHVARRDCLAQAVASLACAAWWFHPGVWWASRRLREVREQACDDRVLALGTRPSAYASHLLDVARAFRMRGPAALAAVAMARRSQLEGRVVAVLDAARSRAAVSTATAAAVAGAAGVALLPLAVLAPTAEPPEPLPVRFAVEVAPVPPPAALHVPVDVALDARGRGTAEATVRVPLDETRGVDLHLRLNVTTSSPAATAAPAPAPKAPRAAPASPRPRPRRPQLATVEPSVELAALVRASGDVDAAVRRSAVWALGRMDDGAASAALVESLSDADAGVRGAAARALGEIVERRLAAADPRVPGAARIAGKADRMPAAGNDTALRVLGAVAEDLAPVARIPQPPPPRGSGDMDSANTVVSM